MPVDCEVFQGSATITIEHLTGEVKPLEAKVGDRIPGGARNLDGRMIVKVRSSVCRHLNFAAGDIEKLKFSVLDLQTSSEISDRINSQKAFKMCIIFSFAFFFLSAT